MQNSKLKDEKDWNANKEFDAIVYSCSSKNATIIEAIYSPQFAELKNEKHVILSGNQIRPSEGKSCTFTTHYEDGRWRVDAIRVLHSPRLQIKHKGETCVLKGCAVVLGVYDNLAWLWNDTLGKIRMRPNRAVKLAPLMCVRFKAVKCSSEEASVRYEAESVCVKDGDMLQSKILHFRRNVLIEANGVARIDDDNEVLLLDDKRAEGAFSRGAQLLPVHSKASILYYKQYNDNGIEMVSAFVTQDEGIFHGINEGFFSTERSLYCVWQFFNSLIEDSSKGKMDPNSLLFPFPPWAILENIVRPAEKSENDGAKHKTDRSMVETVTVFGPIGVTNEKAKNSPTLRKRHEVFEKTLKSRSASHGETKCFSTAVEKRRNSESSKLDGGESHNVSESIADEHPIQKIADTTAEDMQNVIAGKVQMSNRAEAIVLSEQRAFEPKSGGKQGESEPESSNKQTGSRSQSSNNSSQTSEYDIIGVFTDSDILPLSDRPSCSTTMSHQDDFETENSESRLETSGNDEDDSDDVFQLDAIPLEEEYHGFESSTKMQVPPSIVPNGRCDENDSDAKRNDLFDSFTNVDDFKAKTTSPSYFAFERTNSSSVVIDSMDVVGEKVKSEINFGLENSCEETHRKTNHGSSLQMSSTRIQIPTSVRLGSHHSEHDSDSEQKDSFDSVSIADDLKAKIVLPSNFAVEETNSSNDIVANTEEINVETVLGTGGLLKADEKEFNEQMNDDKNNPQTQSEECSFDKKINLLISSTATISPEVMPEKVLVSSVDLSTTVEQKRNEVSNAEELILRKDEHENLENDNKLEEMSTHDNLMKNAGISQTTELNENRSEKMLIEFEVLEVISDNENDSLASASFASDLFDDDFVIEYRLEKLDISAIIDSSCSQVERDERSITAGIIQFSEGIRSVSNCCRSDTSSVSSSLFGTAVDSTGYEESDSEYCTDQMPSKPSSNSEEQMLRIAGNVSKVFGATKSLITKGDKSDDWDRVLKSSKWEQAKNLIDSQTSAVDDLLLEPIISFRNDENLNPDEIKHTSRAVTEFLSELLVCTDICRHIVKAGFEGPYLMASISAYLSGHLTSLDELFDALGLEFNSCTQCRYYRGLEPEDALLGKVICEMLCKMVPDFVEMVHNNCASLAVSTYQNRLRPFIRKY